MCILLRTKESEIKSEIKEHKTCRNSRICSCLMKKKNYCWKIEKENCFVFGFKCDQIAIHLSFNWVKKIHFFFSVFSVQPTSQWMIQFENQSTIKRQQKKRERRKKWKNWMNERLKGQDSKNQWNMKEKTGSRSLQATFSLDKINLLFLVSLLVLFANTDYTCAKVTIVQSIVKFPFKLRS